MNNNYEYLDKEGLGQLTSNLKSKYIEKISANGKTITYTKGDGSTGQFTTQDTTYGTVTTEKDGLMSAEDKNKLDGVETGANKTVVDSDLSSTSTNPVQNKVINSALIGIQDSLDDHVSNRNIHVSLAEKNSWNQIGSQVAAIQNYSDIYFKNFKVNATASEPSDAVDYVETIRPANNSSSLLVQAGNSLINFEVQENGLYEDADTVTITVDADPSGTADKALVSAKSYTDQKVADLVGSAPETLDTLEEVAIALKENQTVTDALDAAIGNKTSKSDFTAHTSNISNPHKVTKEQLGLENVENKSSETIRSELTDTNVATALSYWPATRDLVTQSHDGLMSAQDKIKIDNLTVDTALSTTSTNPVQNKVISNWLQSKVHNYRLTTYTGAMSIGTHRIINLSSNNGISLTAAGTTDDEYVAYGIETDTQGTINRFGSVWTDILNRPTISATGALSGSLNLNNSTFDTTAVKEGYLTWGGKSFSGSYGPIDAAMIPELGADRLAFGKADGIIVEYSRDGGTTWTDYGATDNQKVALFSSGGSFDIGKADASNQATSDYLLRVTIDTDVFRVYTVLNKFAIEVSTNGSSGCYCTIDASLESGPNTFYTFADKVKISGWSGWNIINLDSSKALITYGNTASSQYGLVRFTFGCTSRSGSYNGLQVWRIKGFGGMGWSAPSNMAKYGTIYSYDHLQNVTFPAKVTASKFVGALEGSVTGSAGSLSVYESATDRDRYVPFSVSTEKPGQFSYYGNFKYNPSTNILTTNISGNAATATKATQDESGNVITDTYIAKADLDNLELITLDDIDIICGAIPDNAVLNSAKIGYAVLA